jgi:ribosome biogenesis GTPase
VREISDYHQMGTHTTTFSEMIELKNGGFIIDTPGIKGFGTIDMERDEVSHYFPEIFKMSKKCRFYNCMHLNEPDCAVLDALEHHYISESRYHSYLNILEDIDEGKYR